MKLPNCMATATTEGRSSPGWRISPNAQGFQSVSALRTCRRSKWGYYAPAKKQIGLRPAEPLQMVKTLAHELAHHFAESKASDAESETIAEAVAYVVCSHFGLDTGARSFPYIAVWSKDKAVLKNALGTVQRLSAKIIDGVEGDNRGGEEGNPVG